LGFCDFQFFLVMFLKIRKEVDENRNQVRWCRTYLTPFWVFFVEKGWGDKGLEVRLKKGRGKSGGVRWLNAGEGRFFLSPNHKFYAFIRSNLHLLHLPFTVSFGLNSQATTPHLSEFSNSRVVARQTGTRKTFLFNAQFCSRWGRKPRHAWAMAT